jgi:hypothetical protein
VSFQSILESQFWWEWAVLEESSKEDELQNERNCHRAFLDGIIKGGRNPLEIRIGELPYPEVMINPMEAE